MNEEKIIIKGYGFSYHENINFNKPNLKEIKEMVLNDFAAKLLVLYQERMFMMPNCLAMYNIFEKRFLDEIPIISKFTEEKKNFMALVEPENTARHIYKYFLNNFVGDKRMLPKSYEEIRKWFGKGEFPFIYVNLYNDCDKWTAINYELTR